MRGLDALYRDLEVDRVVTRAAAFRRYRVTLKSARSVGVEVITRTVERTAQSGAKHRGRFLTLEPALGRPRVRSTALRHLAGVTAVRHVLGAPVEAWRNRGDATRARYKPDGVWEAPEGVVAIEYDASGYSRDQVLMKAFVFREGFAGQVWGAATPSRVAFLEEVLDGVAGVRVVLAPWWE